MTITIVIQARDQTSGATQSATANLRSLGNEAEEQGSRIRGFFTAIGPAIVGAGVAAGGAFAAAAGAGLTLNNAMEQATARIQAFTKDSAKTAEIIEMVRTRAAKTPFAFNEMANAAANLLPAAKASGKGLEELLAVAEVLAASNPAEGLEGAAFALKEALSGDFVSVVERFNLPRQRLQELKEKGVPALKAVQIAMQELGLDADLVAGLANTAAGRWSTFMDTVQGLASVVTQPVFDAFSSGLAQVQQQLDTNMPALEALAQMLAGRIASAITNAITFAQSLAATWQSVMPQIAAVTQQAFTFVKSIVDEIMPGVAAVVQAVAGVIADFWQKSGNDITASSSRAWGAVLDIVQRASQTLGSILQSIAAFINTHRSDIVMTLTDAWRSIQNVIQTVLPAIQTIITTIARAVADFWRQNGADIMATTQSAWKTITQIVQTATQIVTTILSGLAQFVSAHGSTITAVLSAAWETIKTVVTTMLNLIHGVLTSVLQAIQGDWSSAWSTLQATSAQFVQGIIASVQAAFGVLQAAFGNVIDQIKRMWQGFVNDAHGLGRAIIDGIAGGVAGGVGALVGAVSAAAQRALNEAKRALGVRSPSRVFAEAVGLPIAQGMALGVMQGAPLVAEAVSSAATANVVSATTNYYVDARNATLSRAHIENAIMTATDRSAQRAQFRRRMR